MTKRTLIGLAVISIVLLTTADAADDTMDHSAVILAAYNQWVETTNARDIVQWSNFLAPGAVFFPADGPALTSKEAITNYYIKLFADPNFALDCAQSFVEISESNDIAWSRGTCNVTFSLPDGGINRGSSEWAKVWVRLDSGEWKCRLNTWNSNAQPGGS
jgi:ketosteroid isomerase-like protein